MKTVLSDNGGDVLTEVCWIQDSTKDVAELPESTTQRVPATPQSVPVHNP